VEKGEKMKTTGLKTYETNSAETIMGKYTWKSGFLSLIYMQEKTRTG